MTNQNPVITSSAATGSFTEDANTTGSTVDHVLTGTMNFTDNNRSDTHTTTTALKTAVWSGGSTLPPGALAKFQAGLTSSIISDSNGSGKLKWTFSEDDRDFDFLAKNETLVLTYEITLKDNHGGSTKKTVKITITGTDDVPVFATTAGATLSEQANKSLSLSSDTAHIALQFTDVDLNNTGHTASVLSVSATGNTSGILPGFLGTAELKSFFEIDNVVKNSGSSNGTVNTTFSAPDLAFDYLAAGEQIKITYVVQVDDRKGGLSTQNVVVTVTGTNDKPVVLALPESAHLKEDHNLSGGNLTAAGDFLFSDLDLSDTHTVSTTVTATRSGGGTVPISNADLIDALGAIVDPDSTSQFLGEVDWNFALPNSAVDFLAEGETLTLKYRITVTDSAGASDTQDVCITVLGINKPVVTKTAAVPGGTANMAGEVISYSISVANTGNSTLTGITVTDPSVSNLAPVPSGGFNVGDTNHDNKLNAGETWLYTASYTVTQADIDGGGPSGDGTITNTVTVDTDQSGAVSHTAIVLVEQSQSLEMTKTASVTSVDAAGDVITYTINVENVGSSTLPIVTVNDPQLAVSTPILVSKLGNLGLLTGVLSGDYNTGDTNENGIEDPGETFQYTIIGDFNDNGIEDPGETFTYANAGDTNRNGFVDPGETWQFVNAGDTDQDGVEDPGETFQFIVDDQVAGVTAGGFNVGDVNLNGALDVGETWVFAGSYTVTQDDIDNGGEFLDGLTLDNTATATAGAAVGQATASVTIDQNPHVTVVKQASVPGGTADAAGEEISYTIAVTNDGNMTLTDVEVDDPSVTNLAAVISAGFNIGDTDQDGKLDLGETWQYTASHTVTQAEMDAGGTIQNTVSVTTHQGEVGSGTASVTVAQNPHLSIDKSGTWEDGPEANGYADAGEEIHYTFAVTNDGNVSLDTVVVSDTLLGGALGGPVSGDVANIGVLDVGETWIYSADYVITAADVTAGNVHNEATATAAGPQDQPASDSDANDVALPQAPNPALMFSKTGMFVDTDENQVANVGGGDLIQYIFTVTNTGNVALSNVVLNDSLLGGPIAGPDNGGDLNNNNLLDVGETWVWDEVYLITQDDVDEGSVHNEATVTALDPSNQVVNAAAQWDTLLS